MFAQLFFALAVMGFNPPSAAPCPVAVNDFGLEWHEVIVRPSGTVTWTTSFEETRSMRQMVAATQ